MRVCPGRPAHETRDLGGQMTQQTRLIYTSVAFRGTLLWVDGPVSCNAETDKLLDEP